MFLVLLYFDQLASGRSEFCKERAQGHHGGSSKLMFSKCQFLVKDGVLIFWGIPHGFPVNSEYSQELCQTINCLGLFQHLPHFLSSEIWPPIVELSFHQAHCSCQNLSCVATVSEELVLPKFLTQIRLTNTWI